MLKQVLKGMSAGGPALSKDGLDFDGLRRGLLMFAVFVRTLPHGTRFQPFFDHVGVAAIRAFLLDGLAPRHKLAIGIAIAAIERFAFARSALQDFAFGAFRAFHADGLLLDVLASRIIAARGE